MRLPQNLDLGAAKTLHSDFLQARGAPIEIDASEVERIGGVCLQVLIAAAAAWRRDGHEFRVVAPSQAFTEAIRLMGAALHISAPELAK